MLGRIVLQVRAAVHSNSICICTSDRDVDEVLCQYAEANNVQHSRGPLDDIVKRLLIAAEKNSANFVVRVWGDCPLICPRIIDRAIIEHIETRSDLTVVETDDAEGYAFPKGQDLEIYSVDLLRILDGNLEKESEFRTYPRLAVKERLSTEVKILAVRPDRRVRDISLTIDYEQDLVLIDKLLRKSGIGSKALCLEDTLKLLEQVPLDTISTEEKPRNVEYYGFKRKLMEGKIQ